ncbi:MAG TPA: hypothetical protein VFQ53_05765 [Kofleriaceae bacterium]|nr:hypothetical protein [Kofleriaceae bacterium]
MRAGNAPPCSSNNDTSCLRPIASCAYGSFDCNPAVDDVIAQITALPDRGDSLAFDLGVLTDLPTRSHHWQSVQRLAAPTGNYLVLSRSTTRAEESDLAIIKVASRDGEGVRLRSNAVAIAPNMLAPTSASDRIIAEARVDSDHTHAGGTQLSGHVLAVPLEAGIPGSGVQLFDMTDPTQPRSLGTIDHDVPDGAGKSSEAGTASLARLDTGKFLLVIGRRDARVLDFYLSTSTDIRDTRWEYLDRWRAGELRTTIDDTNFGDYQNLQLVAGTDDRLYLVGMHEQGTVFTSQWVDLYVLGGSTDIVLTKVAKRRITCEGCNLDAGGGVYVDPTGELIVYGVEYATVGSTVQAMEL